MSVMLDESGRMSRDAFIVWDSGPRVRFDLIEGIPVMVAPASPRHGIVLMSFGQGLNNRLEAFSDRVLIGNGGLSEEDWTHCFFEADVVLARGPQPVSPLNEERRQGGRRSETGRPENRSLFRAVGISSTPCYRPTRRG